MHGRNCGDMTICLSHVGMFELRIGSFMGVRCARPSGLMAEQVYGGDIQSVDADR